jgi:hypothetical protein
LWLGRTKAEAMRSIQTDSTAATFHKIAKIAAHA